MHPSMFVSLCLSDGTDPFVINMGNYEDSESK